jgi:WD40 repeat protein
LLIGGTDKKVYLYDEMGDRRLIGVMSDRGFKIPGHANRVFSIKAHPDEANVAVSAGWDSNLKIYDIRAAKPVASIYGPHVSGDSVDLYDDMIISGNYRRTDTMQMFSLSMQKLVYSFEYS